MPGHLAGSDQYTRRAEPTTRPPRSIQAMEADRIAANIARVEAENQVRGFKLAISNYQSRIRSLEDTLARADARAAQFQSETFTARDSHIESLQENIAELEKRAERIEELECQLREAREQLSRERTSRRHLVDGRGD